MTDYWKSNPRKFCEICGCWMADNKISIQNHEGGMRHKANVEKKMNELSRNNKNAERAEQKLKNRLQQINDSAFVGMMKDLEKDPSLAKRYGVVLTDQAHKEIKAKVDEEKRKLEPTQSTKKKIDPSSNSCSWQEVMAPDGRKYYWNRTANSTQWEKPSGSVAPAAVSVKKEKDRLQHFVLNRLVELSESGSDSATAAVHEAFNAPVPESSTVMNPETRQVETEKKEVTPDTIAFHGPISDLLGPWVPVAEPTPVKFPKLDLPEQSSQLGSKSAVKESFLLPDLIDPTQNLLAHLEESNEANMRSSRQLAAVEKQLPPGDVSKPSSPSMIRDTPRIIFRRGPSSTTSRKFRTSIEND